MSKKSFCPRWQNSQIVMCLAYLFWYIILALLLIFLISNKKNYAMDVKTFKLGVISPKVTKCTKYSIMFFFKSIMPNIKHNIKIICEIHIAYTRYIDPSNRHNFENCLPSELLGLATGCLAGSSSFEGKIIEGQFSKLWLNHSHKA